MRVDSLPLEKIPQISTFDRRYAQKDPQFTSYISGWPTPEQIRINASSRRFSSQKRESLYAMLKADHNQWGAHPNAMHQIDRLLDSNTYTITTAHQPCLFTGPPYIIYKIVSTINVCRQLNQQSSDMHFVPVFWNGGEDHDIDEMNHIFFGKQKYTWESGQRGSVSRMSLTGIQDLIDQLFTSYPWLDTSVIFEKIKSLYSDQNANYGFTFNQLICQMFSQYGLLVMDPSKPQFKREFSSIMIDDVENNSSKRLVEQTQNELSTIGLPKQAHARAINLFYNKDQIRERIIEQQDGGYLVNNHSIHFTREELISEINTNPENFSPNVILRPLYQECILPNVAYIGGGGELAYWLERKRQFDFYQIDFPILIRRCSAVIIPPSIRKKMDRFTLSNLDWFMDQDQLINMSIRQSHQFVQLVKEKEQLNQLFKSIELTFSTYKQDMERTLAGAKKDMEKVLDRLNGKLVKMAKQENQDVIQDITAVKHVLFPNQSLQERHTHISYLWRYFSEDLIETLLTHFDPFGNDFYSLG